VHELPAGVLTPVHSFGLKGDVKTNVHFVEEHLLAYPCGSGTILLNLETSEQSQIGGAAIGGITALGLTPSRRLLAVAERSAEERGVGTVHIYDTSTLKRRKLLAYSELGSASIASVAFSADSKLCLTQGAEPDWTLVLWSTEKAAKALCTVRMSSAAAAGETAPAVRQADFCPSDPGLVGVTGDHILRFFRIMEGQLKPLNVNVKMDLQVEILQKCRFSDEYLVLAVCTSC
jgi:cilia- and flagella-associated protein 57